MQLTSPELIVHRTVKAAENCSTGKKIVKGIAADFGLRNKKEVNCVGFSIWQSLMSILVFQKQKQSFAVVLQNSCSLKLRKFHRKTPVIEPFF